MTQGPESLHLGTTPPITPGEDPQTAAKRQADAIRAAEENWRISVPAEYWNGRNGVAAATNPPVTIKETLAADGLSLPSRPPRPWDGVDPTAERPILSPVNDLLANTVAQIKPKTKTREELLDERHRLKAQIFVASALGDEYVNLIQRLAETTDQLDNLEERKGHRSLAEPTHLLPVHDPSDKDPREGGPAQPIYRVPETATTLGQLYDMLKQETGEGPRREICHRIASMQLLETVNARGASVRNNTYEASMDLYRTVLAGLERL